MSRAFLGAVLTVTSTTAVASDIAFRLWRRYRLGDCSAHSGHTWHYAPPSRPTKRRTALVVTFLSPRNGTFVASPELLVSAKVRGAFTPEDAAGFAAWLPYVQANGTGVPAVVRVAPTDGGDVQTFLPVAQ